MPMEKFIHPAYSHTLSSELWAHIFTKYSQTHKTDVRLHQPLDESLPGYLQPMVNLEFRSSQAAVLEFTPTNHWKEKVY